MENGEVETKLLSPGIVRSASLAASTTYLNLFERGVSEALSLMSIGLVLVYRNMCQNIGQNTREWEMPRRIWRKGKET